MDTKHLEIRRGPSKEVLWLAAMYACDDDKDMGVSFKIYASDEDVPLKMRNLKITSIAHSNNTGTDFFLKGKAEAILSSEEYQDCVIEAVYSTKTRTGQIIITY